MTLFRPHPEKDKLNELIRNTSGSESDAIYNNPQSPLYEGDTRKDKKK